MSDLEREVIRAVARSLCHCHPAEDDSQHCSTPKAQEMVAALLAETRAEALEEFAPLIDARLRSARSEELDDVAAEFERSASRVVKAKGETERTRYAYEVVEVLRNRAREIRDA